MVFINQEPRYSRTDGDRVLYFVQSPRSRVPAFPRSRVPAFPRSHVGMHPGRSTSVSSKGERPLPVKTGGQRNRQYQNAFF